MPNMREFFYEKFQLPVEFFNPLQNVSVSEAARMIEQGGVKLDGARVSDKALRIARGRTLVAQVGKRRFARVTIE